MHQFFFPHFHNQHCLLLQFFLFEYLFVKNPDIDQIKELVEEQIFNVDEITEVNDVSIEIDSLKRSAVIRYEAVTDEKTYKEEVKIGG